MPLEKTVSEYLPEEWEKLRLRLENYARKILACGPACHDWDHTDRVRRMALQLAQEEGGNPRIIEAAAILHDIARPQEIKEQGRCCHAEIGASLVPGILQEMQVTDQEFIAQVAACVRTHRFRERHGAVPLTLEQKIIFDADKLDSLGAIGIGRSFHFAGNTGARVHNSSQEALQSESYSLEDTAYREYLVKLRFLPEKMQTKTGRKLARERFKFMEVFFAELNRECGLPE